MCHRTGKNLLVPRMVEFKNFSVAEIIQVMKQLIEAANISHHMDIRKFMRENLFAVIEHTRVIDSLFLGPEARGIRSVRTIIGASLKELWMCMHVEQRAFSTSTHHKDR